MIAEGQLGIHDMDVVIFGQCAGKQSALVIAGHIGGNKGKAISGKVVVVELFS